MYPLMLIKDCWNILRDAKNKAHSIVKPSDCLNLLIHYTPARQHMAFLKIKTNVPMMKDLHNGKLLRVLKHARGLRILELRVSVDVRAVQGLVIQLHHIKTIKMLPWFAQTAMKKEQTDTEQSRSVINLDETNLLGL